MSKHTPGPWRWAWPEGPNGLPQLEGDVEYSEMNPVLMVAYGCQPKCIDRGCPLLPRKADRDLIAASPDLLETAKVMLTTEVTPMAQHCSSEFEAGWRAACRAYRNSSQRNALAIAVVKAKEGP